MNPFINTSVPPLPSQRPIPPSRMAEKSSMVAPAISVPSTTVNTSHPPEEEEEEEDEVLKVTLLLIIQQIFFEPKHVLVKKKYAE